MDEVTRILIHWTAFGLFQLTVTFMACGLLEDVFGVRTEIRFPLTVVVVIVTGFWIQ